MKSLNHSLIKKPWISEKSTEMANGGKYVFLVDKTAKSFQIKELVENIYKVHVTKVNIVRMNREDGVIKKAIVALKKGEHIDIMPR